MLSDGIICGFAVLVAIEICSTVQQQRQQQHISCNNKQMLGVYGTSFGPLYQCAGHSAVYWCMLLNCLNAQILTAPMSAMLFHPEEPVACTTVTEHITRTTRVLTQELRAHPPLQTHSSPSPCISLQLEWLSNAQSSQQQR